MVKIMTLGAYGYTADTFFEALQTAGVEVFYDIRWRRGVRGAEYAFANAKRLQTRLEALGITYIHRRDLAPPPKIREKQMKADKTGKVAKRKRTSLNPDFVSAYREVILADFDEAKFLSQFPQGARVVALFCVEREPSACHRSLLAERLRWIDGVEVDHLLPLD
jgi:uncharacterized protein (DUF488 family)